MKEEETEKEEAGKTCGGPSNNTNVKQRKEITIVMTNEPSPCGSINVAILLV